MKKILVLLTITLIAVMSFSQIQNTTLSKEDYLLKSKRQQTTGWILLAGGSTVAVVGIIAFSQLDLWESSDSEWNTAGFLLIGGVVTGLISIPFFVNSSRNARKAAVISFNSRPMLLPRNNTLTVRTVPTISLRINF